MAGRAVIATAREDPLKSLRMVGPVFLFHRPIQQVFGLPYAIWLNGRNCDIGSWPTAYPTQ